MYSMPVLLSGWRRIRCRSGAATAERLSYSRGHLLLGKFRMPLGDHRCLQLPGECTKGFGDPQAVFYRKRAHGSELHLGDVGIHES